MDARGGAAAPHTAGTGVEATGNSFNFTGWEVPAILRSHFGPALLKLLVVALAIGGLAAVLGAGTGATKTP